MAIYHRNIEKRRILQDFRRHEEEVIGSLCRLSNRPVSPKSQMEQERRIRREIANSNERRRMQSINAGFQSLRALLPHHEGEKLSKAAILQQTTQYIYQVEQEKTRLLSQNCQLKRLLNQQQNQDSDGGSSSDSPLPKRKKSDLVDSMDEGIGNMSPNIGGGGGGEPVQDELKREMIELRIQLERERKLRMIYEEQTRSFEAQIYPERIREIAQNIQLQQQHYDPTTQQYEDEDELEGGNSPRRTTSSTIDNKSNQNTSIISVDSELLSDSSSSHLPHAISFSISATKENNRVPPIEQQQPKHEVIVPLRGSKNDIKDEDDDDEIIHEEEEDDDDDDDVVRVVRSEIPYKSSPPPQSPPQVVPAMQQQSQLRVYFPSTSRQNLETIVEAIRHLEGDHLFSDDPIPVESKRKGGEDDEETTTIVAASSAAAATDLSYRQHSRNHQHHSQVIQMTSTANVVVAAAAVATPPPPPPTRPGVIVSAHS